MTEEKKDEKLSDEQLKLKECSEEVGKVLTTHNCMVEPALNLANDSMQMSAQVSAFAVMGEEKEQKEKRVSECAKDLEEVLKKHKFAWSVYGQLKNNSTNLFLQLKEVEKKD